MQSDGEQESRNERRTFHVPSEGPCGGQHLAYLILQESRTCYRTLEMDGYVARVVDGGRPPKKLIKRIHGACVDEQKRKKWERHNQPAGRRQEEGEVLSRRRLRNRLQQLSRHKWQQRRAGEKRSKTSTTTTTAATTQR
jgi:hypothetical protein